MCEGESRLAERVFISECTFSFIDPESGEAKHTCTEKYGTSPLHKWFTHNLVEKCLFGEVLTIQVDATVFYVIENVYHVPLDNVRCEMYSLYENGVLPDAILKCRCKEFKVHKVVLASQSPVFTKMFEVDMKEKSSGIVEILDAIPAVVSDLIAYLYTGSAPNVSTLAGELLNAADKYEIPRLFAACEKELKLQIAVDNVVDFLLLADLHQARHLRNACLAFIRTNFDEVRKTRKWKYLKDEHETLVFEALEY